MRPRRALVRIALLPAAIGLLAAAVVLVGGRLLEPSPPAGTAPAVRSPAALPPPVRPAVPVLAAAQNAAPPASSALLGALGPSTADPAFGGRLAGVVLGADGRLQFARAAGTLLPPASTAKLATAVAALATLPPDTRLVTSVVRRGGAVVLVGGGDPTLASPGAAGTDRDLASLDALAASVSRSLLAAGTRTVTLEYDAGRYAGPLTGPGWKPGYVTGGDVAPVTALMVDGGRIRPDRRARHPDPASAAADAFRARLAARGVAVNGVPHPVPTGAGSGPELARVSSPPIRELVEGMLTTSDNNLAEALGREVAGRGGLPRTFAGAAEGIRRAVASLGINPNGLRLVDASGLSTLNRATPTALAGLLVAAVARPALHPLFAGLPVAGFSGTLLDRFRRGPAVAAAGVVRAKTGTLSGVSALAGVAVSRAGTLLIFAFLAPKASSRTRAEAGLDRLAAVLAGR